MQCDIAGVWIPKLLKLFTCIPRKVQQEQNKPITHKFSQDYDMGTSAAYLKWGATGPGWARTGVGWLGEEGGDRSG